MFTRLDAYPAAVRRRDFKESLFFSTDGEIHRGYVARDGHFGIVGEYSFWLAVERPGNLYFRRAGHRGKEHRHHEYS